MQLLVDIDDELLQWEKLKNTPIPIPTTLTEALEFTALKDAVSHLSHQIRNSRLENNSEAEEFYTTHFATCYDKFTKEYVFKVLKNG
jgi:hypothetical protein